MTALAAPPPPASSGGYKYVVAVTLAVVYLFNFVDRQILSILQEPIRNELGLSDTQLGLLTGLVFALFYSTLAIPVAALADRFNRVWIVGIACTIWSLFSAACGLAANFTQLLFARLGVGAGEAGGLPPSLSLIADYFPPEKRGLGSAIFTLGAPVGAALGTAIGAAVAAEYGWRMAFFAVGLPGVAIAILTILIIREPRRGALDPLEQGILAHAPSPPLGESLRYFAARPQLVLVALASAVSAILGYSQLGWAPSFLMRVRGMELTDIGVWYALLTGTTSAAGLVAAGWLVDRFGKASPRAYAVVPAIAFTVALPFYVLFVLAPTWQWALIFLIIPSLATNMYLAPAMTVIQNTVPPAQRAVSIAILLFAINLIGLGGGPLLVGLVSDAASADMGERSLIAGMLALVPIYILAIGVHYITSRSLASAAEPNKPRAKFDLPPSKERDDG